ncbi:MAG: hypothetical protein HZA54_08315 [Planctomycetes bacterium]|nr:hypothetical protein [Planctomycetota bacterium]
MIPPPTPAGASAADSPSAPAPAPALAAGSPPATPAPRGLPRAALVATACFFVLWVPAYLDYYGWRNFLWLCDVALILTCVGTWRRSPLLLSSQLCSNLLVGLLWAVDFGGGLVSGKHLIGGTEYMFQADLPLGIRSISLFHLILPFYLLWAVGRVGYDPRGWRLQTAITMVLLPATWLLTPDWKNQNWVYGLGGAGHIQTTLPPLLYLAAVMAWYPLAFYLPTHLLARRLYARRPDR